MNRIGSATSICWLQKKERKKNVSKKLFRKVVLVSMAIGFSVCKNQCRWKMPSNYDHEQIILDWITITFFVFQIDMRIKNVVHNDALHTHTQFLSINTQQFSINLFHTLACTSHSKGIRCVNKSKLCEWRGKKINKCIWHQQHQHQHYIPTYICHASNRIER